MMMKSKFKFAVVAGVLALSLGAGFAYAAMSADDAIKARVACMKGGHGNVFYRVVGKTVKGEVPFDAAAIKAAFEQEDKLCADWDKWWSADLLKGDKEKTHAKAEIATDAKGFAAAAATWYQASLKMRGATDLASLKASVPAVNAGCNGCHDKFRTPLE
jgi:cytochrome c556